MSDNTSRPGRRIGISFEDEASVAIEINRLRHGYRRAGNWSLGQVCDHLDKAIQLRMTPGPFPANTPEQDSRTEMFALVLKTGRLPDGIEAPEPMLPPPDCGDEAISACLARLEVFRSYTGPIAPHRLFGNLSSADARRLNLIHCAHHISFLVPVMPAQT